ELGTAFTYQGRLEDAGGPVNMLCDFLFSLYGSMGGFDQIGVTEERISVLVEDGYFTVPNLDYGPVFWGESRYLEVAVRCPSGEGAFETLSPRQELTAAPYAIFAPNAGSVPWDGISAVPPGFADGIDDGLTSVDWEDINSRPFGLDDGDDNTTYTNGSGLILSGNQFSVNFGGSGSASLAAHSDHDHLGQTWAGSNNPLTINGSFGTGNYAPLVLSNSYIHGDGLVVDSVGRYGMYVNSAGTDGVFVQHAGGDGVYVASAGNPSTWTYRGTSSGFEVAGAESDGVFVGHAGEHGVWVSHAGDDGIRVSTAGSPATTKTSSESNGVEVNGAAGYGLWVGFAGFDGVRIMEPADDGIQIGEGTEVPSYGLFIPEPGVPNNALWVNTVAASGNWGLYTPDNIYGGNLTASSYLLLAKVDGLATLTQGDVVAATGIADPMLGSLSRLPTVRKADSTYDGVIGVVQSRMELQLAPGKEDEGAMVLQSVPGQAQKGDYVTLTVLGVTDVRVDSSVVDIMPGQRLTASELPGFARGLRTEMLGDMPVTEGAPVIGIALAMPTPGVDTIPVFVTLR
ncbi:MAG: hypothetical protein KAS38_19915, partial [Anaerolineales bacterium]|nr:hypothetical protein [Anaerolineales bacterium]